jgi:Flp pilus assembly protein protease CpaA
MMKTTTQERLALLAIALGVILTGWMDAEDAKLMEAKTEILACTTCAGGAR